MAAPLYVTQSGRLWHAGLILLVTGESRSSTLKCTEIADANSLSSILAVGLPGKLHIGLLLSPSWS